MPKAESPRLSSSMNIIQLTQNIVQLSQSLMKASPIILYNNEWVISGSNINEHKMDEKGLEEKENKQEHVCANKNRMDKTIEIYLMKKAFCTNNANDTAVELIALFSIEFIQSIQRMHGKNNLNNISPIECVKGWCQQWKLMNTRFDLMYQVSRHLFCINSNSHILKQVNLFDIERLKLGILQCTALVRDEISTGCTAKKVSSTCFLIIESMQVKYICAYK